jgi:FKBP-type peptidyl-prolyl cis-trans isomerase
VIRGLDLGLEGMRIGGSREIVIPAVLGYGAEGYGDIPANQTLVFRVTLVGVENKRR